MNDKTPMNEGTPTYFQGNSKHPQHISVGAILVNDKGEVCCHHVHTKDLKGYWADEIHEGDFYLLMRETPEAEETLEHALWRGLVEEFGATAKFIDYVGSIVGHFRHEGVEVEKTTLYFLCRLSDQDLSRRSAADIEGTTTVEWRRPEYLIPLMKQQPARFGRTDIDESSILERAVRLKLI